MQLGRIGAIAGRVARYAAATSALLLIWGVAVEPRFILDRRDLDVPMSRLPGELDGFRIAVIADLQIGMWLANRGMVRRVVDAIVELRPDAALIAGDFIYDWQETESEEVREEFEEDMRERAGDIREIAAMLRPLAAADVPTFAVLGNHDYGMMWPASRPLPGVADAVEHALERSGVSVLRNEAAGVMPRRGAASQTAPVYLVGIDAHLPHRDRAAAALRRVPDGAPRVVFMHHPASFAALPADGAPLAIAAHTHGGQVRVPGLPGWSWLVLAKEEAVHADGWIPEYGEAGNRLYVNRGIGFSTLPIRINCPPELTVFTLRRRR